MVQVVRNYCLIARQPAETGGAFVDRQLCGRNLSCSAIGFPLKRKCSRELSRACIAYHLKCDNGITRHVLPTCSAKSVSRKIPTTFGLQAVSCDQGCARLMNQRQHDSSYQPLAMDSSPQLPSGTNYTISTIVPRSNRRTTGRTVPPRTRGIHGPGRLPADRRAPLFGDARYP